MKRFKLSQQGTIIGEFADMVVTPYRLSNCALNPKITSKRLLDIKGNDRGPREKISFEFLHIIKGKFSRFYYV